jgi:hypothetical protein
MILSPAYNFSRFERDEGLDDTSANIRQYLVLGFGYPSLSMFSQLVVSLPVLTGYIARESELNQVNSQRVKLPGIEGKEGC